MFDNRMNDRSNATGKVPVYDRSTGNKVGLLVNISAEGLQMISKQELGLNRVLELAVELPESLHDEATLDLDAEIVWTRPNDHLGVIDNGLRLRYVSSEAAEKLQSLIRYYTP